MERNGIESVQSPAPHLYSSDTAGRGDLWCSKYAAATPLPNPPSASAQGQGKSLEQRVNDLEAQIATLKTQVNSQAAVVSVLQQLLAHFSREGNNIFITGANLNIVNGLGATNGNPNTPESVEPASMVTNGLGNPLLDITRAYSSQLYGVDHTTLSLGPDTVMHRQEDW